MVECIIRTASVNDADAIAALESFRNEGISHSEHDGALWYQMRKKLV